jgi:anthranilate/para-aminobenzoate synthase component I
MSKEINAWFKTDEKIIFAEKPFWGIKFEQNKVFIFSPSQNAFKETALKEPFEILRNFALKDSEILIGFIGYEFAKQFESAVENKYLPTETDFPSFCFFAFSEFKLLDEPPFKPKPLKATKLISLIKDELYLQMVESALQEIKNGNTYEINLSRPFVFEFAQKPSSETISANLWQKNPAPFSAYLKIDPERAICSASPECFLRKTKQEVSTFPIKGTRKRLDDKQKDQDQIEELINSSKEMAEHLMVVDLERNDLGKIAIAGSVRVKNFSQVHSFSYVHHLVSEVNCQLKPALNIFDVLQATFPSGSITGAPKIKTMQIINKLEPFSRTAYTGSFGFIDSKGDGVFSILIRTLFLNQKRVTLNVGGGIVLDSEPQFELEETYIKAKSFFDLLL